MNQQFLIVWSALAISQVIYLFVPAPLREGPANLPAIFPLVLGAIAFVQGVGMVVLLRVRAFNPIQGGRLDPTSKEVAAQLFTTLILAWVLAESVALYGLVLRFLQFELLYSASFAAGGALLLFLGRPWQSRLGRPASAADMAGSNAPLS